MLTWYFSKANGYIVCPEQSVQLTPKASEVLACLMRHQGEVVSTETVLQEVWPNVHVTADLVREYISDLRAALHDDARNSRYIETVRGKGFRLIGGVDEADADMAPAPKDPRENRATVAILKPQVAGNADLVVFAECVGADIINFLSRHHEIGVVARQSSFTSEDVTDLRVFARDVDAQYVLESSVSSLADIARSRFQLVDAVSGRTLWAERFDSPMGALVQAADEIVLAVVSALTGWHGELHRAEFKSVLRKRHDNLNAYEHFILGCDLELKFTPESLERAIFHLERATVLDPSLAKAWLVLAVSLLWALDVMPERDAEYRPRSNAAFERAFTLGPTDPVTLALVALKMARDGDRVKARETLDRAAAKMTGDTDALVCVAASTAFLTSETTKALEIFDRAMRSNPTPPFWFPMAECQIAFLAGDYPRCLAVARTAPQQISVLVFTCLSHAMLDNPEQALLAHGALLAAYPHIDFTVFADHFPVADPDARAQYDAAVERLHTMQLETEANWPSLRRRHP